jgi:hypothetical protein
MLSGPGPKGETSLAQTWLSAPHFDVYDFGRRVSEAKDLPQPVRDAGREVAEAANRLVAHSFADERMWPGFAPGKNGAFFVVPDGSARFAGRSH